MKNFDIKKGQIVVLSSGEYSDYRYMYIGKALLDFCSKDIEKYEAQCNSEWGSFDEGKLVAILDKEGFFEEIDAHEIHVGDYGRFDLNYYGKTSE